MRLSANLEVRHLTDKLAAVEKVQATIEFELDGAIVDANANFLSAMGYTLKEAKGRRHSIVVDQKMRDSAEHRTFWDALRRGEFQAAEYKRVGKGGRGVRILAAYNPVLDANGKPARIVKFVADVTAQA